MCDILDLEVQFLVCLVEFSQNKYENPLPREVYINISPPEEGH